MRRATFLARRGASRYLNSPKRPEREWPWGLAIILAVVAGLGTAVAVALTAK